MNSFHARNSDVEMILPQSLDAERSILGAILIDNQVFDEAAEYLQIPHLYLHSHQRIFSAMLALRRQNQPVDLVTLGDYLRNRNELERVGGATFLATLIDGVPRTDTVAPYLAIVLRKAQVREIYKAAHQIIARCVEDPDDPALPTDAQQAIFNACASQGSTGFTHMAEVAMDYLNDIEAIENGSSDVCSMLTGLDDFDQSTMGLHRGELIIIAGRPSNGKTALAKNMATHISKNNGNVVGFMSLEDGAKRIAERVLAAKTHIDSNRIRSGMLTKEMWKSLSIAVQELAATNYFLNDDAGLTSLEIRTRAQRLKQASGRLDLLIVDYLQLMGGRGESKRVIVGNNANELKAIAKDLDCAVLATSQLSRRADERPNNEPELSDLRESGEIEQAADVVAFIYNEDDKIAGDLATIKIAKNRNGRAGDFFKMRYFTAEHRIENYAGN